MNERSTLSTSTGSARRRASEEWPVPKSSMRDVDAELLERVQALQRRRGGAHQRGLGQLEADALGREPGVGERGGDDEREVRVLELAGGDVDGDGQRASGPARARREVAGRGLQDPGAERADQPGLLGHRDELRR